MNLELLAPYVIDTILAVLLVVVYWAYKDRREEIAEMKKSEYRERIEELRRTNYELQAKLEETGANPDIFEMADTIRRLREELSHPAKATLAVRQEVLGQVVKRMENYVPSRRPSMATVAALKGIVTMVKELNLVYP